jgi:hypothetical protein
MRLLPRFTLLVALLPLFSPGAVRPTLAAPLQSLPEAHVSGKVYTYDNEAQLLSVNTRLGLKRFIVTNSTVLLLNNHTTAFTNITTGDQVTVDYQYETSTANTIRLIREASRTGMVTSTTATGISLRLNSGAVLPLVINSSSVLELGGIPLTTHSVLVGRRVTAVYEPGTLAVLSLEASSKTAKGTITAVDPTGLTLAISGKKAFTFAISSDATVRRTGASAELTDLVVGDRVVVAYLREASTVRALAIDARAAVVTAAHAGRKN